MPVTQALRTITGSSLKGSSTQIRNGVFVSAADWVT